MLVAVTKRLLWVCVFNDVLYSGEFLGVETGKGCGLSVEEQDHQQGRAGPARVVFGYRPVLYGRAGLGFFVPALRAGGPRKFCTGPSGRAGGPDLIPNAAYTGRKKKRSVDSNHAGAALGDAALAKSLSRGRRSVKLATPSVPRDIWTYIDLGAVSAIMYLENCTPWMEYVVKTIACRSGICVSFNRTFLR